MTKKYVSDKGTRKKKTQKMKRKQAIYLKKESE